VDRGLTAAPAPAAPGVHRLPLPTPFAIGTVNAYLLEGEPLTLVDPGPRWAETRTALSAALAARGRRVEELELVVLTHQHHDHVGLAGELRERAGVRIAAIAPLARYLADFDAAMDADDAYAVATMRRHGVAPDIAASLAELSRAFRRFSGSAAVERVLAPGDRVVLGGRAFTVHLRPGHSPTDTVLHEPASGLLLGGDHLLERVSSNPIAHAPIGVADPVAEAASPGRPRPLLAYLDSLAETAAMEIELILPGHGEPFDRHREAIERRRRMHARRARMILRHVGAPRTAADVARELWRRLPVSQAYLALSETLAHLDLLERDGRVVATETGGVVRWRRSARAGAAAGGGR
jgi:glyoxylase-like metal-dependent hydrolase (beta-lactamase superfamily II)